MKANENFIILALYTILNWHDEEHRAMWNPYYDVSGKEIISELVIK